jgi:hypothetical protein
LEPTLRPVHERQTDDDEFVTIDIDDTGQPPDTPHNRSPRCRLEAEAPAPGSAARSAGLDESEQRPERDWAESSLHL